MTDFGLARKSEGIFNNENENGKDDIFRVFFDGGYPDPSRSHLAESGFSGKKWWLLFGRKYLEKYAMKRFFSVFGILAAVFVVFLISGCATVNGILRDARALKNEASKVLSPAPPPAISLEGIPKQERTIILQAAAACESRYVSPPKYYPPTGDVIMDDAMARYQYEACLQGELNKGMLFDAKCQKRVRSSCVNLKGVLLENCMEGVRVSHLSRKARDVADRRDRANQARSAVTRKSR